MPYKLNINDINLNIVGRTNEKPPWRHEGRKLDYNHLIVIISENCTCRIEKENFTLNPYDLLFIPANKFYILETDTHCEYYFACFYPQLISADKNDIQLCNTPLEAPSKKFFLPQSERIKSAVLILPEQMKLNNKIYSNTSSLFIKMIKLNSTKNYLDRLETDIHFKEILLLIAKNRNFSRKEEKYPHLLEHIITYINENYTECITTKYLADIFSVSKPYICALFSSHLNMTASEYINSVKLSHATELLSNSSMNITQISEYLGFSGIYYFSRVFKKFYGVSPTKYSVANVDK